MVAVERNPAACAVRMTRGGRLAALELLRIETQQLEPAVQEQGWAATVRRDLYESSGVDTEVRGHAGCLIGAFPHE